MSGWFKSLGWWSQEQAFDSFSRYRDDPINGNLHHAIEDALPIIRVVFSTQKLHVANGDEDDLIGAAALTITKAIPKMAKKPKEKIGNDKQYMRYLFTCVINAFFRELDIIYGKQSRLNSRLEATPKTQIPFAPNHVSKIQAVEARIALAKLPGHVFAKCVSNIRFKGYKKHVCIYILQQMFLDREISKSVLNMLGCDDRNFYTKYCLYLLHSVLSDIRNCGYDEHLFEEDLDISTSFIDYDNMFEDEELISALLMESSLEDDDSQNPDMDYSIEENYT